MIDDATHIQHGACLHTDVCIVGAGPAGIALALDLSERGLSVMLLESGHLDVDAKTQALYEGEVADERMHSPPDKYRHRRLGGSSAIWGGRCMPMDPIDFESRNYVADSGWPISYTDLLPYYPQANTLAEAGRFSYDASEALGGYSPAKGELGSVQLSGILRRLKGRPAGGLRLERGEVDKTTTVVAWKVVRI